MLIFIITLILHFSSALLLMFVYEPWDPNCPINLRTPSLHDLKDFNKTDASYYADCIIAPAHCYFSLKKDLSWRELESDGCFTGLFIQSFSIALPFYKLLALEFESDTIHALLCLLLFPFCGVMCFIIHKLYKKFLCVKPFGYTAKELRDEFKRYNPNSSAEYISEDIAFQNWVLEKHYNYLLSVKERTLLKKYIAKVLSVVAFIILILDVSAKY